MAVAGVVALLTAGCPLLSVLVHVFGPQSHVVRCMAILWVAVDPIQPCALSMRSHCCNFKVLTVTADWESCEYCAVSV